MRHIALLTLAVTGCVGTFDELDTAAIEQGLTSNLIDQGFGFGGQATGGASGQLYVVTSTTDDGACGTLRYGVEQMPGATWIVFDPPVFPPTVKKAIYLNARLTVPSNTTIDGRGSWVSLRRTYDASNIYWTRTSSGTYECNPLAGFPNKGPIVDIREVTLSSNKITSSNKGISIGSYADATSTGTIRIAASVYRNRFVSVNRRQPRVEATVAHIYNNVYEDWRSSAVQVHATNEDDDPVIVNSRGLIEHNVFRAVTRNDNTWVTAELGPDPGTTDPQLWARTNKCTTGASCTTTPTFPACGSAWYFPCTQEMRGNLISLSSMDYATARDTLRPLGGSSRTVTNDVSGNFLTYTCEPPLEP